MTKERVSHAKKKNIKKTIFYISIVALPLIQFFLFYICVNINSVLLAFRTYDPITFKVTAFNFDNFKRVFSEFSVTDTLTIALKNSLIAFVWNVLLGMTTGLIFSYYIFKKFPFSGLFKVVLFMPSIVSSIVMTVIYSNFVDTALPSILNSLLGTNISELLSNPNTRFATILVYNLWIGFGTQILMYVGAMNNVSVEVIEAGKIDGANFFEEFIYIVFPGIYSTFVVFVVVNIVQIFTNQLQLYSFYGKGIDNKYRTIGYHLYEAVQSATSEADYPYPAAIGILSTLIVFPVTLLVQKLLTKLGPKEI